MGIINVLKKNDSIQVNEKEHEERPKISWVKVTTNDMLIEKLIKSAYESTK